MANIDFAQPVQIDITLGHAIFVWETLSNHFSDLPENPNLNEEERKSIWGLTDLIEKTLYANGIEGSVQWQSLIQQIRPYMSQLPVDFIDD